MPNEFSVRKKWLESYPLGIGARRVKTTRQLAQIRPTTRPFFLGELFFFGIFYGYKNTGTQVHRYTGTQVHRYTGTQVHRYTGTQVHRYTGTQVHRYTGTQVHRYTGTQVHRHTGTQVHRYTGTGTQVHHITFYLVHPTLHSWSVNVRFVWFCVSQRKSSPKAF